MKNLICLAGLHKWTYTKEKHIVRGHPYDRETIRIIVRECDRCGKREHHGLPMVNGKFGSWVKCNFNKDAVIFLKRIS